MDEAKKYALLAALGIGAVVAVVYFLKQGGQAVAEVAATKLNPYSQSNALYDNVIGGAGRAITGDSGWSLGGALYDFINGSPEEQVAKIDLQQKVR